MATSKEGQPKEEKEIKVEGKKFDAFHHIENNLKTALGLEGKDKLLEAYVLECKKILEEFEHLPSEVLEELKEEDVDEMADRHGIHERYNTLDMAKEIIEQVHAGQWH